MKIVTAISRTVMPTQLNWEEFLLLLVIFFLNTGDYGSQRHNWVNILTIKTFFHRKFKITKKFPFSNKGTLWRDLTMKHIQSVIYIKTKQNRSKIPCKCDTWFCSLLFSYSSPFLWHFKLKKFGFNFLINISWLAALNWYFKD